MFGKKLFAFVSILFVGLLSISEAFAQEKKEILFVSDGSRVAHMTGPAGSFEGTCEIVNRQFSDCNYRRYLEGHEQVSKFVEQLRNNGISVDITVDNRIHGAHVTQVSPESFARVTGNSSSGSNSSSQNIPDQEVPTSSPATGGSQGQSHATSGSGSGNRGSSQLPRPSQVEWLGGNRNSSVLPDLLIFHAKDGKTYYFMAESGYSDHVQMVAEETGIPADEIAWEEGQSIWRQSNHYGYKAILRQIN